MNDFIPIFEEYADITLYTDDTNLVIQGKDYRKIKQKCDVMFPIISLWLEQNGLIINVNKYSGIFYK